MSNLVKILLIVFMLLLGFVSTKHALSNDTKTIKGYMSEYSETHMRLPHKCGFHPTGLTVDKMKEFAIEYKWTLIRELQEDGWSGVQMDIGNGQIEFVLSKGNKFCVVTFVRKS